MHKELLFEHETPRIKSLAFHPTKPVLLASHHTGPVTCWDLYLHKKVNTFTHHEGPVRAICFHPIADIFATGGDDTDIVLWSFSKQTKLHVFKGHGDYIRSLDFHKVHPWLMSSSDDQTIKIWNFQSKKLLSTISGHSHYVMCSKFIGDFIASCSLDQSIRIWDYSGLLKVKEKNIQGILGVPRVVVRQIIDSHDKGVNWIERHPEKNQFLSCADDRQVKLWEYSDTVWEKDAVYSHQNNVTGSCFLRNGDRDVIVSVGEDGHINFYDKKGSEKLVFDTRFWCVNVSKDGSVFAVGHDSGLKVYWAQKHYLPYSLSTDGVYFLNNNKLMYNNLNLEKIVFKPKKEIVDLQSLNIKSEFTKNCKYIDCVLVQYNNYFEVVRDKNILYKGVGKGLLLGSDVLYNENGDLRSESGIRLDLEDDLEMFYYDDQNIITVSQNVVDLINLKDKKIKHSLKIKNIKKVLKGSNFIIFYSNKTITVTDLDFNIKGIVNEMIEITGIFFLKEEKNNFSIIYSTMKHIKYGFNEGNKINVGILRSMEKQITVLFKKDEYIFYLTKEGLENVKINFKEYEFKIAINEDNNEKIQEIVKEGKLPGQGFINYLISKGKGDVILPYIKDKRIEILIGMGKLKEACAEIEKNKENKVEKYQILLEKALETCDLEIAEKVLWKLKDYQSLFILFICSKQHDKIKKMKRFGDDAFKLNLGIFLEDKDMIENILFKNKIIKEVTNSIKYEVDEKFDDDEECEDNEKYNNDIPEQNTKLNDIKKIDEEILKEDCKVLNEEYEVKSKKDNEFEKDDPAKKYIITDSNNVVNDSNKVYNNECEIIDDNECEKINNNDSKEITDNESDQKIKTPSQKIKVSDKKDKFNEIESDFDSEESIKETAEESIKETDDELMKETDDESDTENKFDICESSLEEKDLIKTETNYEIINKNLLEEKQGFVKNEIDYNTEYEKAMKNVTEGKFTTALQSLKEILYTIASKLNENKNEEMRKKLGTYISGLSIEKKKKKVDDIKKSITMTEYFANLNLEETHKKLAKSNLMMLCFKNENYDMAKKLAIELNENAEGSLLKLIKKILKSSKQGNKYIMDKGTFCFDTLGKKDSCKMCLFCYVYSENGEVCTCCEIGMLQDDNV